MMVTETVVLHGKPYFSRELSALSGFKWSLDIRPLGVARGSDKLLRSGQ